ncbi:hypothetical protein ACJ41O_014877 [Fusarium nematophilum]
MDFLKSLSQRPLLTSISALATALIIHILYRGYRQRRFYRNLPGPPHSWLFGHLKVLGEIASLMPPNCHPQIYYTEIARRYSLSGIFYLDLWPIGPPSVVLSDPDLLDEITVRKPLPQHPHAEEFLNTIIGRGAIAGVNGPVWKWLHHAMAPAFSWSHIRSLTGVMVDECGIFRQNLDKLASTGEVFSMEDLSGRLIFDVISRIVFNFPLNAQTTGSQDLDDLRELIVLANKQMDISVALNPLVRIARWWRRRSVLKRLHPSVRGKIHERLGLLVEGGVVPSRRDPTGILDLMLREYVEGKKMTREDESILLTNINGLLIGGHGTTTDSLCFIYMLLSKSPHVVSNLLREHSSLTPQSLVSSPESLQHLPYTEAVITEALRLFPVGFGVRQAAPGATLTYGGKTLPIDNGLAICTNGHDAHYNERFFPDPTEFRPERWLNDQLPRSYFRTFGRGLRACLGKNLAMNELKIILILTLRDYEFECAEVELGKANTVYTNLDAVYGDVVFQELGLEGKPRGGMMMTVKKRV